MQKNTRAKHYVPISIIPVDQAWMNLASDCLQLAIEDARQEGDPYKRDMAKNWLISPAAKLLFDSLLSRADINISDWVIAGCPKLT